MSEASSHGPRRCASASTEDSTLRRSAASRARPGSRRPASSRCPSPLRSRLPRHGRATPSYRVVGFGLDRREVVECFEAPRSRVSAQLEPSRVGPGAAPRAAVRRARTSGVVYKVSSMPAGNGRPDADLRTSAGGARESPGTARTRPAATSASTSLSMSATLAPLRSEAQRDLTRSLRRQVPSRASTPLAPSSRRAQASSESCSEDGSRPPTTDVPPRVPQIVSRRGHAGNARHSGQAGLGDPEAIGTLPPLLYEELIGGLEVLVRPGRRRGDPARAGTRTTGAFEGSLRSPQSVVRRHG